MELVRSPLRQRELPGKIEQPIALFAKTKTRKPRQEGSVARQIGQSRFRR